ncbi:helix-turn-helix domain-containing protein [Archangium primigenium]|uniref:helix-turn-helix domain-containing protein n=1 Tax=[Archangium] primigenium TaxID=2792470 RepID=UPI001959E95E|nr:helix-turn-helix transcriptional regulator [Archangium primigenium]MBM7115720.1 helix-turn-helix transcriptional regulator [Archangium primigenium]
MPTPLQQHLATVAKDSRLRLGLTQTQMARRTGLAAGVYGRIERARMMPSVPTLLRLCDALQLDANTLLGFQSKQPPPWLAPTSQAEADTPGVRRFLRTIRTLRPVQHAALATLARSMLAKTRAKKSGAKKAGKRARPVR